MYQIIILFLGPIRGFIEHPSNLTCEYNKEGLAVFRCVHQTKNVNINWKINGIPVHHFPEIQPQSSPHSSPDRELYTVTIPTNAKYNHTEVKCVVFFQNGTLLEESPPATLIISPSTPINTSDTQSRPICYSPETIETTDPSIGVPTTLTTENEISKLLPSYTQLCTKLSVNNSMDIYLLVFVHNYNSDAPLGITVSIYVGNTTAYYSYMMIPP